MLTLVSLEKSMKERNREFQEQKDNYNLDRRDYSVFDELIKVTMPFYEERKQAHEAERRKLDRFKVIFLDQCSRS
jgi:hypothetical protein